MRIKLVISYDGSRYYGFQIQPKKKEISIQEELQKCLSKIYDEDIKIVSSGRTDKGVHALNQVIHFDTHNVRDLNKVLFSMNKMLPNDILVKSISEVDESFHARFSAKKKHYRYIVSRVKDPFKINYSYYYSKTIDLDLIKQGMNLFIGEHNFVNFCSNKEYQEYIRTIYSFDVKLTEEELVFDIVGSGFKRYMVRMIIGTLLALNSKQINLDYIVEHLQKDVGTTLYNACSCGLFLVEVIYD